jgi:mRNA interferase HigB
LHISSTNLNKITIEKTFLTPALCRGFCYPPSNKKFPIWEKLLTFPKWEYILFSMKVISAKTINAYRECYPEADSQLKAWMALIEGNAFKHFPELKNMFGSADFVPPDRVIFNIKGKHFRLITAVDFGRQAVFVKWFGRHKDYDKINPSEVQHEYPPC